MGKRVAALLFSTSIISAISIANENTVIPPVVVKAPKKTYSSPASGPESIITHQQITAAGEASLVDTLQNLAGLQLQNIIGNGSQVALSMRGFGSNATSNTLLLVNGIPITNPDLAPPDLNLIPVSDIKYIEIISGSESVLYGDQAVGGLVNVITGETAEQKINLSCSMGSYNLVACTAALNQQRGQLNYNVAASHTQTDNYREHNANSISFLTGGAKYNYISGSLALDYNLNHEYMQYPGALTAIEVRQNRQQANNDIDYFVDNNAFIHLNNQQILSSTWLLQTDFAHRQMQGNGVLTDPFTQSRTVDYLRPELKGTIYSTTLVTGADAENDSYQLNSLFGLTQDHQQKYGLFALATYPFNEVLHFSLGARGALQTSHLRSYAVNDNLNRAFAATLGMTYQYNQQIQFYLRRAGSFRFPKADENANSDAGVNGLRTQRGVSYETGMQMVEEQYTADINLYQLALRDEIAFDPTQTPTQPFGANRNLSPTLRRGFSLSGKDNITDRIALNGQYNFVDAEFQNGVNAGNRIPLVAANILRAGVDYHFVEDWHMYVEGIFTGNQFPANDDANIAGRIGGYTVYNVNLRYEFKHFSAALHVNNIFNKYYYFYTVYEQGMPSEFFYPAPGRNIAVTVNYAFL